MGDTSVCTQYFNVLSDPSNGCMPEDGPPVKLCNATDTCGVHAHLFMNATDCLPPYEAEKSNLTMAMAQTCSKCVQYIMDLTDGCTSGNGPDCSKFMDPAGTCAVTAKLLESATDCAGPNEATKGEISQAVASCTSSTSSFNDTSFNDTSFNDTAGPPTGPDSFVDPEEDSTYPESALPPQSVNVALEITVPQALATLLTNESNTAARDEFEEAFETDMEATLSLPDGAVEVISISIAGRRRLQPGRRLQSDPVSLEVITRITIPTSAASDTALGDALTLLNQAISSPSGLSLTTVEAALASSSFDSACSSVCQITVPQQTVNPIDTTTTVTATTTATTTTAGGQEEGQGEVTTATIATTSVTSGSSSSSNDDVVEASPATCVASNIALLIAGVTTCVLLQRL